MPWPVACNPSLGLIKTVTGGRQLDGGQPAQHGAVLVHTDATSATQEFVVHLDQTRAAFSIA